MRLLSIDGWDVPCALSPALREIGNGRASSVASLRKSLCILDEFGFNQAAAVHALEFANPCHVVTAKNR